MSHLGHPKKDKKQLSLAHAFGIPQHSNQPCHFENGVYDNPLEGHESDSAELLEEEQPSKRPKIAFKSKWKTRFPWAYAINDCNDVQRMKCLWCVKFKRETPFSKEGILTLHSGLNIHAKSKAHKFALQLLEGESKHSTL